MKIHVRNIIYWRGKFLFNPLPSWTSFNIGLLIVDAWEMRNSAALATCGSFWYVCDCEGTTERWIIRNRGTVTRITWLLIDKQDQDSEFISSAYLFLIRHWYDLLYGIGTVIPMLEAVMSVVPREKIAVHFHDTYGQSLANILISLQVSNLLEVCWCMRGFPSHVIQPAF